MMMIMIMTYSQAQNLPERRAMTCKWCSNMVNHVEKISLSIYKLVVIIKSLEQVKTIVIKQIVGKKPRAVKGCSPFKKSVTTVIWVWSFSNALKRWMYPTVELSNRKPSLLKRRKRHKIIAVPSCRYGKLVVWLTEAMLRQLIEGKTIINWCK